MTIAADVLVVGGGLGGAITALELARRGVATLVVDRAVFPRDKPCGEGLLPHGVAALEKLGLRDALAGAPAFRGIRFRCGDLEAAGDFPAGAVGRGVQRRVLDDAVRARAAAAGVVLRQGRVTGVAMGAGDVRVRLGDGETLVGRFLVGADGARSRVRAALGLDGGRPRRARYGLRAHFRLRPGVSPPPRVEVEVGGGFELYVTPVGADVVGVAALVEDATLARLHGDGAARLAALVARSPAVRGRLDGAGPLDAVLACGPLRVRARAVATGRALLVGDAAGYVDAVTGEGMSLAIEGAVAAAAALAEAVAGRIDVAAAGRRYARARAALVRDHVVLTHALLWLARHPALARRAIARLARDPALFGRLLGVADAQRSLPSLPLADFAKLALGARGV